MSKRKRSFGYFLIITHVLFRDEEPVEGPYSSVVSSLLSETQNLETIKVPLYGYTSPILFGDENALNKLKMPSFLGKIPFLKYLIDFFATLFLLIRFGDIYHYEEKVVIAIDPLSALPAILLKFVFKYKLIFYSVDFNENRFNHVFMQKAYEFADKWASKFSDQVWVVCESLADYKRENYGVESIYIPNSAKFDPSLGKGGKPYRKGNKLAWTGTLITDRQYEILFGIIDKILEVHLSMEVFLVPIKDHEKFQETIDKKKYKNVKIVKLTSRRGWQEFLTKCDVGLAVYDEKFGSTKYIEPLKIWDFLLCGVPFIISCEPSISKPIKDAKVAYFLGPANSILDKKGLKNFLEKKTVLSSYDRCIDLAKEYAIDRRIGKALKFL